MSQSMKVAVSIPDDLFNRVDRLARSSARSRSAVYAEALDAYVREKEPDEFIRSLDAALATIDQTGDTDFVRAASDHLLRKVEW